MTLTIILASEDVNSAGSIGIHPKGLPIAYQIIAVIIPTIIPAIPPWLLDLFQVNPIITVIDNIEPKIPTILDWIAKTVAELNNESPMVITPTATVVILDILRILSESASGLISF